MSRVIVGRFWSARMRESLHSHCLLWTEKSIVDLLAYGFVRADIPDPEKEPELHSLVMRYQIHNCKDYICGGPGRYGKCSKGFPADVSGRTFHQPGNPRYTYARTEADVWVVPYNAQLLLIWEGHCNVQFVTSQGLASYITKYVTKNEPLSHIHTGRLYSNPEAPAGSKNGVYGNHRAVLGFGHFSLHQWNSLPSNQYP